MAYLGETIKKLGFGLMRLPQKDGAIDIEQTKEMVDLFLGAGFTYFDTAWPMPAVRTQSAGRWWSGIPGIAISWRRRTPPGSTAKHGRRPQHSWTPP